MTTRKRGMILLACVDVNAFVVVKLPLVYSVGHQSIIEPKLTCNWIIGTMYAPWWWFIFWLLSLCLLFAQVSCEPTSSIPDLAHCLDNRAMSDISTPATPQDPRVNRGNRVLQGHPSTGCASSIAESDLEMFRKFPVFFGLQNLIYQ